MQGSHLLHFAVAKRGNDDWTGVTERSERKRRQNRLNQRAMRRRKKKEEEESQTTLERRPYRVDRWRIEQSSSQKDAELLSLAVNYSNQASPDSVGGGKEILVLYSTQNLSTGLESLISQKPSTAFEVVRARVSSEATYLESASSVGFPLSSDHLLRLIHFNAFRALISNKSLLSQKTSLTKPEFHEPLPILPSTRDFCDGLTIIHPHPNHAIPQSLHPTTLQMSRPHSSWLNMFPYACFRNNLIAWEGTFDGLDLLFDLFGELLSNCRSPSSVQVDSEDSISSVDEDVDDVTATRRGLIVWGEPWDPQGWEVTPGFLRKWAWLLEGCEELIESSNRWRAKRDEAPLLWGVDMVNPRTSSGEIYPVNGL